MFARARFSQKIAVRCWHALLIVALIVTTLPLTPQPVAAQSFDSAFLPSPQADSPASNAPPVDNPATAAVKPEKSRTLPLYLELAVDQPVLTAGQWR